jgi:putative ABC transport system substrate-binding protein
MEGLREGLRELNYIEGRNIILEQRRAANDDELPKLAAELVRLKPDVIVAVTGRAALALTAETKTVPIVMATSGDAVGQGLIVSLARPGGNVTGMTVISPDLAAKRMQVLKEAAPLATRIGVIGCPEKGFVSERQWSEVQRAAQRLGLRLVPVFVRKPQELPETFDRAIRQKIDAVLVLDCSILALPEPVTGLVTKARVAALYPFPRYVQAGGLMSYGPNTDEQYRRAAVFVDKILKGAKPAEIPVEQPTKFELLINLKVAKALGVALPPSLIMRADKVIE